MKISAVITTDKFRINALKLQNNGIIIVFLFLALGLICGCVVYTVAEESCFSSLGESFINFATDFSNKNKPEIFSGLIISDIPYLIIMLVLGVCSLGAVPALLASFFKCAGIGAVATYLYTTYALKGIEYCLLILFPSNIVLLFSILILTQSCYATSTKINRIITNKSEISVSLQEYIVRSVLIYCMFLLSTLIKFVTIISFNSLFSFS